MVILIDKSDIFYVFLSGRNLIYGIHDLFSAGGETTTTTLRFAVLYLLHHPDIQERLFRDISEAAGDGRLPTYSDRKK